MDPRLAVHAGPPARQKVTAWLAALAVVALASPAAAAPKTARAKKEFDRGVAAYQKQNYAVASEALGASYKLEADIETLFAWAQSERQLERCDKSIELFGKLLELNLPAENKKVVQEKIDECKAIIAAKQPAPPEKQPASGKQPAPPEKQPASGKQPAPPEKQPAASEKQPESPGTSETAKLPERPPPGPERSPWWKDPIGDGLVVAGVIGLGVGGYYLMSASQAEHDSKQSDKDFVKNDELAKTNGRNGVIAVSVGVALVAGGIVRYVTRGGGSSNQERTAFTGWFSPDGGGVAAMGHF
jgi:tetratricopeptide (TPR) repeat protein